jgi:uncharacterized protein YndB with AHSA1/START domain
VTDPYDIEITRVLDAPPELVYQAFTDPDQFAEWYGLSEPIAYAELVDA